MAVHEKYNVTGPWQGCRMYAVGGSVYWDHAHGVHDPCPLRPPNEIHWVPQE